MIVFLDLSGNGRMMKTTVGFAMQNKRRLLRVTWQDRGTNTSSRCWNVERQLEESERSRMELERFVRLEWPRTENDGQFLSIPS